MRKVMSEEKFVFFCKQFQKTTNTKTTLSSEKFESDVLEIKEKPV